MQNDLNKTMLVTAAWTLGVAFVVFSYGCALASLAIPLQFSKFCENLGANTASAYHFEAYYHRNHKPENLYIVLDKYSHIKADSKVVKYFNALYTEQNEEFKALITKANNALLQTATNKEAFALTGNEGSRLKSAYIKALLNQKRYNEAKDFFVNHCTDVDLQYPDRSFFVFVQARKQELVDTQFETYFRAFENEYIAQSALTTFSNNDHLRPLYFLTEGAYYLGDDNWNSYRTAYNTYPFAR